MTYYSEDAVRREKFDPPQGSAASTGAPPEAIRMDFARRLQSKLNEKGWTQSELARRMAPLLKDSRIGRDNISKYVRGKVLPLPPALEAMARVLEMRSSELLPMRAASAAGTEHPPVSVRSMGDNEQVWMQINMALSWDKALEIQKIIRRKSEDEGG